MPFRTSVIYILLIFSPAGARGQSIPVGITHFDDFARRQQLLGDSFPEASLMIRPVYPDRFENEPYRRFYTGQSALRLTHGSLSLGLSSENLWWGPGSRTSILMSNNAPGFAHITLNTVKPIKTPVGKIELQIIGGRFEASGFRCVDTAILARRNLTPVVRRNDWRYLNAMTVNYQPRWFPGLSVGGIRGFTLYGGNFGNSYRTTFPLLEPFFKVDVGGEAADTTGTDQVASVYARWIMPRSHSEVYVEFGRTDHSWDATDFALEPDHYRAFIAGFRKLAVLNTSRNEYIDVQVELTRLSRSYITSLRSANSPGTWYSHYRINHGYTHFGQVVGSGIGISSDLFWMGLSWVRGRKKIGIEFYRLAHDEDFWAYIQQKSGYGDWRSHWIDCSGAIMAYIDIGRWLLSARVQGVAAYNYMHLYVPDPGASPFLSDRPGVKWNLIGELSLVYGI